MLWLDVAEHLVNVGVVGQNVAVVAIDQTSDKRIGYKLSYQGNQWGCAYEIAYVFATDYKNLGRYTIKH
jgi:hypothetical protein